MKCHGARDSVELSLGPHNARAGWEVARLTYDAGNPKHLAQIHAAITAMVKARGEVPLDLPPRQPQRRAAEQPETLAGHIRWHLDANAYGGVVCERVLAALPLADGLYCGLVLSFPTAGKPTMEFWERSDDLERQGFVPIGAARARAICDALPRFLERLEQVAARAGEDAAQEQPS